MSSIQSASRSSTTANLKCIKGCAEGMEYEKLTLLLLAKNGYELSKCDNFKFRDFAIGRDVGIGNVENFADLIFSYVDESNVKNLIFVETKHKQNDYKIDSKIFSTESSSSKFFCDGSMRRHFNLQKYFISYLKIREKLKSTSISEEFRNGRIKYIIIFTNIGLNTGELKSKGFILKEAPYDIINLFTLTKSSLNTQRSSNCYQFEDISEDLRKVLKKSSDLHRVAREFAQYVVWENQRENKIMRIDDAPIKYYHVALDKEVIQKSDPIKNNTSINRSKAYCEAQFREDFVDNEESGPKLELRDAIFENIREFGKSRGNVTDYELKNVLKKTKWKVVANFGKAKKSKRTSLTWEWRTIENEDIIDFLQCLVFVVNQPRVTELEALFRKSLEDTMAEDTMVEGASMREILEKVKNTSSKFREHIQKVSQSDQKMRYKKNWITRETFLNFIEEQKQLISMSFFTTAMTVLHENEVMQYGKFKELEKLEESLNMFLKDSSKILCITTSATLFSSIKILQYLNTIKDNGREVGRISTNIDILKSKINRDSIAKAFALEKTDLLTIECRQTINEQDVKIFYCKLREIINRNHKKKLIIIVQQGERVILLEKFKNDFQSRGQFIVENDFIDLRNFEPVEDPLKKEIIIFQGQEKKISLAKLTGINSWNSLKKTFQNEQAIIDMTAFVKILNNDEIEVGSKPPSMSNLNAAYTTLFEEIDVEIFANKLISQELDSDMNDIYVMSVINGSNEQEKIDKLIMDLGFVKKQEKSESELKCIADDSKIRVSEDQFKDEDFKKICCDYPEKRIYWVNAKYEECKLKLFLRQFYNPNFYLKRAFHQVIIKTEVKELLIKEHRYEIFIFLCVKGLQELIDTLEFKSEKESTQFQSCYKNGKIKLFTAEASVKATFKELCKRNETVHWFRVEEKQLMWCDSHGSVKDLREFVEHKDNKIYSIDEDNFIRSIGDKKTVVIADRPFIGKTTTLTMLYESNHLSESFNETHWIIRIALKVHLQDIRNMDFKNGNIDVANVVDFFSKIDIKLNHKLAKNLLEVALNDTKKFAKPLLLIFDGFDEVIDVEDRKKIIFLLKFLKEKSAAKLWITTRPQYKETLESALSTFAIVFTPLNEKTKIAYIKEYLKARFYLILDEEKFSELFSDDDGKPENSSMELYIEALLNNMYSIFRDNMSDFERYPFLLLDLVIEFFATQDFKEWIQNGPDRNLNFDFIGTDVLEVHKKIIDWKYNAYFQKKNIEDSVQQNQEKLILDMYCKELAISFIFKSKTKSTLKVFKDKVLSAGIIKSDGNNIEFIHGTFTAYFAAKLFIEWIEERPNDILNSQKQEYILEEILKKPEYELIRTFINLQLKNIDYGLFDKSMKDYGTIAEKLFKKEESALIDSNGTVLHIAIKEGNKNITYFLLYSLIDHKGVLKKFLFATDENRKTALHLACRGEDNAIVKILLDIAARISEDTLQEFLCFLNDKQENALHEAVMHSSNVDILLQLLRRANNKLDLILNEENMKSSLCSACWRGKEEFVKMFVVEFQQDEDSLKHLLLFTDEIGNVLCRSIGFSNITEYLLLVAKALNDNNETLKKLLLPERGHLPFLEAAKIEDDITVKLLINVAKEIGDDNHTVKQLFFNDKSQESALHVAAKKGNCAIIKLLLETAADIDIEMLEKLIFAVNKNGTDAVHLVVENGHEGIFADSFKMLEEAKYLDIQKKLIEILNSTLPRDKLAHNIIMLNE